MHRFACTWLQTCLCFSNNNNLDSSQLSIINITAGYQKTCTIVNISLLLVMINFTNKLIFAGHELHGLYVCAFWLSAMSGIHEKVNKLITEICN